MRRLTTATMLVVAGGLLTLSPQITPVSSRVMLAQDADSRLESQLSRILSRIASDQARLARKYESAGAVGDAIRQLRWAVHIDPDCGAAWRALGYTLKNGEWVPGSKPLVEPEEVDPSTLTGAEKEAHEKKQKEIADAVSKLAEDENKLAEKATEDLVEFAQKAIASGEANLPLARRAGRIASWYSPNSGDVGAVRGFIERNGEWYQPAIAATIDMMQKALADAPRGEVLDGDDPQAKELGWDNLWRTHLKDTPWIVRTTRNQERPHRLMQVVTASESVAKALTGSKKETRFRSSNFTYTEVGQRSEYDAFIDKFDQSDEKRKANLKRLTGTGTTQPYGFLAYSTQYSGGDDMCAHNIAATILRQARGFESMPWVTRGFGYLVTSQMLNTTSTRFYTFEKVGRTTVRGSGSEPEIRRARSGPARLRRMTLEMIYFDDSPDFGELSVTGVNDLTERHVAKSLSLFEMLTSAHPEVFRKWIMRDGAKASDDLEHLIKLLETDRAGLEALWKAWVLESY